MSEFHLACRDDQVVEGRGFGVVVDGLPIAVFRDQGALHALLGRCPHANGSLAGAWVDQGEAVCPLHGWRFKLSTGRCTTASGNTLHKFPCEVRDGWIYIGV